MVEERSRGGGSGCRCWVLVRFLRCVRGGGVEVVER